MGARYRKARRARAETDGRGRRRPSDTPTLDATYAAALHDELVDSQAVGGQLRDVIWAPVIALFRAVFRYTDDLERRTRRRR